jgi:transcriptional regulator with GAF, ATPase, and Fis domain
LSAETQVMLLRVLQEREFQRVGGNRAIRADARVIAATNLDLEAAVAAKTFRADLFYRLNVFPIEVPALRDRETDIPLLVEYFVHRYAKRAGTQLHGISKGTLELLQGYPWPGNVRELQNVIERAVTRHGHAVGGRELVGAGSRRRPAIGADPTRAAAVAGVERPPAKDAGHAGGHPQAR